MAIFKNKRITISDNIVSGHNLSWAAKGILIYIISKPNNCKIDTEDIVNHSKNDTLISVEKAIEELIDAKYLQLNKEKFGRFYEAYAEPQK